VKTIAHVLPVQDNYYLLYDGTQYARHGSDVNKTGLLVFANLERAEQFCITVGKGLSKFVPTKVSADEFLRLCEEHGAFCVAEGMSVKVCSIVKK